ncbi:hypothetical protein [Pseudarthrobacter sp. PS3-L1]|uniref:hypothetical protein n=1 Tax=Pseudarthrobacter sp. PS3-L1 TaxID=3046207 RepID=UPI0024B9E5D6|nr:hypothetical protein [Pseudarthrobacter sp. PS3-L1]MDJ0321834.1 hypothetical protein [Pseudarthrobacter sp. PS3-L1]
MAIDYTTPLGQVRLLIAEASETGGQVLSDEQVMAFLTLRGDNVYRAAAAALRSIAVSEALTSKVISAQDVSVDGAKLATELRALAKTYDDQAAADHLLEDNGSFFSVHPLTCNDRAEGEEARI